MARDKRDEPQWDPDDAIGVVPNPSAYRWTRSWTYYVAVMCGLIGFISLIGAVEPFSFLRFLGGSGVIGGAWTIRRVDRALPTSRLTALWWFLGTLVVVVGGAALWLSTD